MALVPYSPYAAPDSPFLGFGNPALNAQLYIPGVRPKLPIHRYSCITFSTRTMLRKADAYLVSGEILIDRYWGAINYSSHLTDGQDLLLQRQRLRARRALMASEYPVLRDDVTAYKTRAKAFYRDVAAITDKLDLYG